MTDDRTARDIRVRYSEWILLLAAWAGAMTAGTLLLIREHLFGWTGPVARAGAIALGMLTCSIGSYPFCETSGVLHGMSRLTFRAYTARVAPIWAVFFVFLAWFNSMQRP